MLFPVKIPYTISADITKYSGPAFNTAPDPFHIRQKDNELKQFGSSICGATPLGEAYIAQAARFLGKEVQSLSELALCIEEDVAILKQGIVEAICFCFPSGFIPTKNLGLDFFQVHAPVADGDKLRASGPKVASLISKEGAMFRRYVWGISSLGSLSQHPAYRKPVPTTIEDLFFRTETQTTVGLTEELALFFVKVEMHPLQLVWEDSDKRKILVESVRSMSEAVLAYKHMKTIKTILLDN